MTGIKAVPSFEELIPESLGSQEFRSAWKDWADYRALTKKAPLTEKSARIQLKDLERIGARLAVLEIERSIQAGWRGLFPRGERTPEVSPTRPQKPRPAYDNQQFKLDLKRWAQDGRSPWAAGLAAEIALWETDFRYDGHLLPSHGDGGIRGGSR